MRPCVASVTPSSRYWKKARRPGTNFAVFCSRLPASSPSAAASAPWCRSSGISLKRLVRIEARAPGSALRKAAARARFARMGRTSLSRIAQKLTFRVEPRGAGLARGAGARARRRLRPDAGSMSATARRCAEPGAFRDAATVAGRPVIFCRDGRARCAASSIPAATAAPPCASSARASSATFTCPYHGWTYDGDGALVARAGRGRLWPRVSKSARLGLVAAAAARILSRFLVPQFRRPTASRSATYLAGAKEYIDLVIRPVAVGPAARSSPGRRNTTSAPTGSCWSRTASTTTTCRRRIRPGSTTCARPASRRGRRTRPGCCCRPRARARISATATSPPTTSISAAGRSRRGSRSMARTRKPTSPRSAPSWCSGSARRARRGSPTPTATSSSSPISSSMTARR